MSKSAGNTRFMKNDGMTQQQRMPGELDPAAIAIDDRTAKDLFEYVFKIAKEIRFTDHLPHEAAAQPDWQDLLNIANTDFKNLYAYLQQLKKANNLPPHLALLFSFIENYKEPQRLLNNVTARHLDHYYEEVLALKRKPAIPDKAHIVFGLKKNVPAVLLEKETTKLLAGKDKLNKEQVYQLTHDVVVNNSHVGQLRSVYVAPGSAHTIQFAAVANSADGLGAALDKNDPKWNGFGHDALPVAAIGFCLGSEVMQMKEGERTITVKLGLSGPAPGIKDNSTFSGVFLVSITGEKGWTDAKVCAAAVNKSNDQSLELAFTVTFSADDPAIIDYDALLHGEGFSTNTPLIKVLLNNNNAAMGYAQLGDMQLQTAVISVQVKGMTNLQLENDFGQLNPLKPFYPFGPAPENDANFWIGSEELLSKALTGVQINVEWKDVPAAKLGDHYKGIATVTNSSFTANVSFADAAGWMVQNSTQQLFDSNDATKKDEHNVSRKFVFGSFFKEKLFTRLPVLLNMPLVLQRSPGATMMQEIKTKASLYSSASFSATGVVKGLERIRPQFRRPHRSNAVVRNGFIHMSLNQGFLFRTYREKLTKQVLDFSKGTATTIDPLNEPYAPQVQTLTVDYSATTGTIHFDKDTLEDFIQSPVSFFHADVFGQMKEHAYARKQTRFLNGTAINLLPSHSEGGNLFIGLSGIAANDAASLLFQVAEGSEDPDSARASIQWSVLCDNYWKPLTPADLVFDTTNGLLTSGVVKLVIPPEATTINTIMPSGLLWLKLFVSGNVKAVCQLIGIHSNAAIAVFEDKDNDPLRIQTALPAGSISKLQLPDPSIATVAQPYASFAGNMEETETQFYTRVSERLRHKERSITRWDAERLILEHFPQVYKVKCINHASSVHSFADAGHVLAVVVPDLTRQHFLNPFQPRVNKHTLEAIHSFLRQHSSAWVSHHVVNPLYEPVKISVSVKLKAGLEFNYFQQEINKVLQIFLSPWAGGSQQHIHFGGRITEANIIQLLEGLGYVDYITGLSLYHSADGGNVFSLRKQFVEASGPASILVSHIQHEVKQS